jgi:hypothetical protein
MTFNQIDLNLDRFKYIIQNDGISIEKKSLFSSGKKVVPFEDIGSLTLRQEEKKLFWLIISLCFVLLALLAFTRRLSGHKNISDTAELFWLTIGAFFFIVYAIKRKNRVILAKDDNELAIEFVGLNIYKRQLNKFIETLQQKRDDYLKAKYPRIDGLTVNEIIACVKAGVQYKDALFLKKLTKRKIRPLKLNNDFSNSNLLKGICSSTTEINARKIIKDFQDKLRSENKYVFISEFVGNEYKLGFILNTSDPFNVMEFFQTNGANYDIDTKSIIEKHKKWHSEFGINIVGIGSDFCECEILNRNIDYKKLAKEIYEFCPDVVEQGTDTIEQLEIELAKTGRIFLWWD